MKAQSSVPVKEKTLKIISDLLTDICDESTTGKDTNNCKLFHNFIFSIDKTFFSKENSIDINSRFFRTYSQIHSH